MANTIDSRPNFSSFPMPISTDSLASSSKPHYNYTYATPSSTPIKPYPSYFYHYRPASPSQRSIRRTSASVPNLCMAASSSPPPPARSSLLSVPPKSYTHSREKPTSRSKLPSADACHPAKREDDKFPSAQPQQSQQPTGAEARQARLIAEHAATVKRMEERQRKAQSQSWFEESQKLAAEAARIQQEEFKWADEKLRRIARERDEEERGIRTREQEREHERKRPQTRPPPASEWQRDKSRAGVHKSESGYGREQRPEHKRAKSEGSSRETGEARERVKKDRAGPPSSPSSIAAAWEAYQEASTELMHAKPPKGKASGRVTFYDIPWPVLGQASSFHDLTNEKIAAFLLSPHHSQGKSPKARLRAAILIWHPDKFAQKVFPHIAESHRPAVGAGVDIVARIITELISSQDN